MSVQKNTIHTAQGSTLGFFRNLRIGPKIIVGYLLLILLMAGVAGVAYWGLKRVTAADDLALKRQSDAAAVWAMRRHMVDQYGRQADLIINGNTAAIDLNDGAIQTGGPPPAFATVE